MLVQLDTSKVLNNLAAGKTVNDACDQGGISYPIIAGLRKIDPVFAKAYDTAYAAGENARPQRGRKKAS